MVLTFGDDGDAANWIVQRAFPKKSLEATKQSLGAWIAFGVCLAMAGACALVKFEMAMDARHGLNTITCCLQNLPSFRARTARFDVQERRNVR